MHPRGLGMVDVTLTPRTRHLNTRQTKARVNNGHKQLPFCHQLNMTLLRLKMITTGTVHVYSNDTDKLKNHSRPVNPENIKVTGLTTETLKYESMLVVCRKINNNDWDNSYNSQCNLWGDYSGVVNKTAHVSVNEAHVRHLSSECSTMLWHQSSLTLRQQMRVNSGEQIWNSFVATRSRMKLRDGRLAKQMCHRICFYHNNI